MAQALTTEEWNYDNSLHVHREEVHPGCLRWKPVASIYATYYTYATAMHIQLMYIQYKGQLFCYLFFPSHDHP